MEYNTGIATHGRTVLMGPNDPAISAVNCSDVIDDLTPSQPEYGTLIAPYSTYLPLPIVQAHEDFHVQDSIQRIFRPIVGWMKLEESGFGATSCSVPNPYQAVHGRWSAEVRNLVSAYSSGAADERRAYDQLENPMLNQWVQSIRIRARNEGWPSQCQ